jgi:hypothetical protein
MNSSHTKPFISEKSSKWQQLGLQRVQWHISLLDTSVPKQMNKLVNCHGREASPLIPKDKGILAGGLL